MKKHKYERILDIYCELEKGKVLKKEHLAKEYEVDERTIQRDIDDIRAYYCDSREESGFKEIVYDYKKGGYRLKNELD